LLLRQYSAQPICNNVQGEGVAVSEVKAVEWFKLAAAQGHEASMNALYVLGKWARTAERFKQKGAAAALDRLAA
jgi:TPR repeat protein